ncbi:hypothetical protein CEN39_03630 [Fischerella thermalis CCMEE 5201]|nr:hypothetical protein CEN39_03630 [Fischerella thermalis CCMEE 5201]
MLYLKILISNCIEFTGAITGMEEALGEKTTAIALTAAGRYRGKTLAQELDLANSSMSLEELADKRLQGKHTESVLRGGNYDVFEFTKLS